MRGDAAKAAVARQADFAPEASNAIAVWNAGTIAAAERSVIERAYVRSLATAAYLERRLAVVVGDRDAGVHLGALVARRWIRDA